MANEVTPTATLAYSDSLGVENSLEIPASTVFSVSTKIISRHSQSIPTTAGGVAINLGGVSALGYIMLINRDASNYVELLTAVSGTVIARLEADGGFAFFKVGSGVTAPALIANTAACVVDSLICSL